MSLFRDLLLYGTVRLECFNTPQAVKIGTGFYHSFDFHDKSTGDRLRLDAIVTNRHVVHDLDNYTRFKNIRINVHVENPDGEVEHKSYKTLQHDDLQAIVVYHPDKDIDLALVLTEPFFRPLMDAGLKPKFVSNTFNSMGADHKNFATRDIVMVGYPMGHWDNENNMPILRKGALSTSISLDYRGRREFVIDAGVYPGSSGSPVYEYSTGINPDTKELCDFARLLGIVYASIKYTSDGILIATNDDLKGVPSGLGVCIKAHLLRTDFDEPLRQILGVQILSAKIS